MNDAKVTIIINPVSGANSFNEVKKAVIDFFEDQSYHFEIIETKGKDDAYNIAKQAILNESKLIVSVGGDGTINEIINAIANTNTCMAIIPNGTGNLLATSLGIPIDINKALKLISENNRKKIDLGKINGHYFSIIAGCGFDAAIMKNVKKEDKKLLGFLAYFIEGFKQAFMPKRAVFNMVIDNKKIKRRGLNVMFINSGNIFGNLITLVPNASMTDGLLDVCMFSPGHTVDFIPVLWKILTKENYENKLTKKRVLHFKAKNIDLKCRPKLPMQADGDFIGYPPVKVESCPAALEIIVPKKVSTFVMDPEEFFKSLVEGLFNNNQ